MERVEFSVERFRVLMDRCTRADSMTEADERALREFLWQHADLLLVCAEESADEALARRSKRADRRAL